jgi:hypothetical protein
MPRATMPAPKRGHLRWGMRTSRVWGFSEGRDREEEEGGIGAGLGGCCAGWGVVFGVCTLMPGGGRAARLLAASLAEKVKLREYGLLL